VLTAALLILPAAAARFWTEWLGAMLLLSAMFGAVIGAAGTMASAQGNGMPTGPMIVLAGAVVFLAAMLLARRRGLIAKALAEHRSRQRVDEQKLLLAAHAIAARGEQPRMTFSSLLNHMAVSAGRLQTLLQRAIRDGLLQRVDSADTDTWSFTDSGLRRAAAVTRAYRLWRLFLTEYPDSTSLFANLDVEQIDELLPSEMVAELQAKLGPTDLGR
jgi:manganese/zinc/iron transport system permease protein